MKNHENINGYSKPQQIDFFSKNTQFGKITKIAAGGFHSIALCDTSNLFSWGAGNFGQLGNGKTIDTHVPQEVPLPFKKDKIV